MNYRHFVTYNVLGGLLWVWSMLLGGFWLGTAIPDISRNIHLVIGIVVLLSILPAIIEALRIRAKKKAVVVRDPG